MTKIWAYGNSKTKTATGEKWEGNVIAVPKGYKLGEIYTITYVENGVEKTITAKAVDRTPGDSFSAPKNSPITKALGSKNVEIALQGSIPVPPSAPAEEPVKTVSEPVKAVSDFTTEQGVELAELFNNHGLRTAEGGEFSCAGCIVDAPEQAAKMAEIISENAVNSDTKIGTLKAIFAKNPEALKAIDGGNNSAQAPAQVESLPIPAQVSTPVSTISSQVPLRESYEPVDDKQLAQFLNEHSSVHDMTCQACIKREAPTHKDEFEKIIIEKGTPAHLAEFNRILGIKQSAEVVKTSPQFCSLADAMKSSGIKEQKSAGDFQTDLLVGGYYVGGQNYGNNGFVPFAQGAVKYNLSDNVSLNAGASIRPESDAMGSIEDAKFNPLEFNIKKEFDNGVIGSAGLSTWIGNHNYQRDPFSMTSLMACGCTGGATGGNSAPPARDGIFSAALNEVSIAGLHAEKVFNDETFVRASVGMPINSMVFDSELAAMIAARHKLTDNVEVSATIAAQADQAQVNGGLSYEFESKAKIAASLYGNFGDRLNTAGVEFRGTTPIGEKTTLSLSGLYEHDRDLDVDAMNARLGIEHSLNETMSVGAFGLYGTKGGDKETGGGIGANFKF